MPLTTLRPPRGAATISNEYLAALITPNDLPGGVDYVPVIFDEKDSSIDWLKKRTSKKLYDKKKWLIDL